DLALQDTQAKIAQAQPQLPPGVKPPTVSKSNPDAQPIITVGVMGAFSRHLLPAARGYRLGAQPQTVPGAAQGPLRASRNRNVRIWVDGDKLVATGTTVSDITTALAKQHVTSSGGQLSNGQRSLDIRVLGEAADLATLRNIVVRKVGNEQILLGDVALVQDG